MPVPPEDTVTRLIEAVRDGDREALNQLFPLVYEELRAVAHRQRQRLLGRETINTTALVHEAYMKLLGQANLALESRVHFFRMAAQAMRQILIDYARQQQTQKRGGDAPRVSLEEMNLFESPLKLDETSADALVALDEAMHRLARTSQRQSQIVECRFFGGMTIKETAMALEISPATVKRNWILAQVWLFEEIKPSMKHKPLN